MPRAVWNGVVIAEADVGTVEVVESNTYFPAQAVHHCYVRPSDTHTVCPWKGTASYYDIAVDGKVNRDAAWGYPQPKKPARQVSGRIAFWRGVRIED